MEHEAILQFSHPVSITFSSTINVFGIICGGMNYVTVKKVKQTNVTFVTGFAKGVFHTHPIL